jgi:transcriptional regulator with XRE-family HTH domain
MAKPQIAKPPAKPPPEVHFAAWVRALRLRLGLTQEEFAQRLAVSPVTVSRWECGARARPMHLATRAQLRGLGASARLPYPTAWADVRTWDPQACAKMGPPHKLLVGVDPLRIACVWCGKGMRIKVVGACTSVQPVADGGV